MRSIINCGANGRVTTLILKKIQTLVSLEPSQKKAGVIMANDLYRLTASEIVASINAGKCSVEDYARSLLERIEARDEAVQAWAYLDPEHVIAQAKALDAVPSTERGPLHGVAIAVKDVIYTKGGFTIHRITFCMRSDTREKACRPSSIHLYTPLMLPKSTLAPS